MIDKERRWCLLIALTRTALEDIRKISPPLADRLTDREINIERLSAEQFRKLVTNYLNLSRESNESFVPFTEEALNLVNKSSGELPRLALRKLHFLVERAADESNCKIIDEEFVNNHLQ